jgi:ATP-dependent RNA helicase DDX1
MLDWKSPKRPITTDGVHQKDRLNPNQPNPETLSEAIKVLKGEYVVRIIDAMKMDQGIIFCRTKLDCDNLERHFNKIGGSNKGHPYTCVCLHGDRKPQERQANLETFKKKMVKFLICTDVAARGIDVKGIPFVINVTLPDEKANYVHRIGRVGRAERMGLAVSLVSEVPEKVWYHSNCSNRGRGCYETGLVEQGGCCMWYNELQLLGEIEEHLITTIPQMGSDLKIQVNDFDGKITYGAKKAAGSGLNYQTHVQQLAGDVMRLSGLEMKAQSNFLKLMYSKKV